MEYSNQFFKALGIAEKSEGDQKAVAKQLGVKWSVFKYYNEHNKMPTGKFLEAITETLGVSELKLKLVMGCFDKALAGLMGERADELMAILDIPNQCRAGMPMADPDFSTEKGHMYKGDCIEVLKGVESDSVDMVFADPPFNLAKLYPSEMDDSLKEEKYIEWSEQWIEQCIRVLKPGGSFLIWQLPYWNSRFASFLHARLTFRHWIATEMAYSLPIRGKLYPAHYSLLYFVKGEKADVFSPDRLPMQTCRTCFNEIKDYGGYKDKMNPGGINLSDVWSDISPVRHTKYKKRVGANELPVKLMDRIIEMSTKENDLVLDPFGGSGTTYVVSELKKRRWLGVELGPLDGIEERFANISEDAEALEAVRGNLNTLFPEAVQKQRVRRGIWTPDNLPAQKSRQKKLPL